MPRSNEQEVLAQEEQLTQATRRLDIEALDAIYAEDIMFTGVTGVICDKAGLMDEARRGVAQRADPAGRNVVAKYDKEDIRLVVHGDTGVTSFRFVVTIEAEGKEVKHGYRTTNVWVKGGGRWQVVAAHTAALAAIGGAA
jgi:ketosteroid isomerase-like protein